ncbi:MAG: hypothetical protein J6Q87_03670 [Clostridia bacterium]|nr:hypothetical protein [Clostridia bacterium]
MSELPITKLDYEKALLMVDFLTKTRSALDQNNSAKFTPLIKGYKIDFEDEEKRVSILLDLHGKLKTKLIVNVFVNDIAERNFMSFSKDDNDKIIKELF